MQTWYRKPSIPSSSKCFKTRTQQPTKASSSSSIISQDPHHPITHFHACELSLFDRVISKLVKLQPKADAPLPHSFPWIPHSSLSNDKCITHTHIERERERLGLLTTQRWWPSPFQRCVSQKLTFSLDHPASHYFEMMSRDIYPILIPWASSNHRCAQSFSDPSK